MSGVAEVSSTYPAEMASNSIPVGYKQTEVGVIPEDWQLSNIRDVSAIPMQNGLFYEPKRKGKGVPLINVGDMYTAAPVDVDSLELFNATAGEIKVFRVVRGDLFFTRSSVVPSGIAYCNIFDSEREDVVFDSHLIRVRPNTEILEPRYLYLNCIAKHCRTALIAEAKTATMTTIDQGAINRCPVLVPPKKEQTAIANALSDVDALISELEKLIAKKQAIKTATMQQLLTGRTRLPQFTLREDSSSKGTKPSELGEIPEDWEVHSLSSICDVRDGTHDSPKYKDNGIPLVTSKNIVDDILDLSNVSLISPEDAFEIDKRSKVDKGDIIMSMIGTVGSAVLLLDEPKFCIKNVALFKPKKVSGGFLVQLIRSKIFQDYLEDSMDGGIQKFVSLGTLRNMEISLPSEREQAAIATILSDMDTEIQALEQRLGKTRQIKQGMMQELLTGRVRLISGELKMDNGK